MHRSYMKYNAYANDLTDQTAIPIHTHDGKNDGDYFKEVPVGRGD